MGFTFLQPNENVIFGATVTTPVGAVEATFNANWLTDGRNRPVRSTTGTVTWLATGAAAGEIGLVVIHSHTIEAARTITIAGGVSGSGAGPAARTNGIPTNPGIVIGTPASTDNVSVAIASNPDVVIIAEMLAGKRRSLTRSLPIVGNGTEFGYLNDISRIGSESRFGSVPAKDLGLCARWLRTQVVVDQAEAAILMAWFEGTRSDTRPSAIVPFDDFSDVWVVRFIDINITLFQGLWIATMLFEEWPRRRWLS